MCNGVEVYIHVFLKLGVEAICFTKYKYLNTESQHLCELFRSLIRNNHRPLWHLNVHYRVHKILPLIPILSHLNPLHALTPYFNINLMFD
jgi:hypothetical protein